MRLETLQEIQLEAAYNNMRSLVGRCRERYLAAAAMMELDDATVTQVREIGFGEPPSPWRLLRGYKILCDRYNRSYFTAQENLFFKPGDEQDAKWIGYFWYRLMPKLLERDEMVRNVLRAGEAIPSEDPQAAGDSFLQECRELVMPKPEEISYPHLVRA